MLLHDLSCTLSINLKEISNIKNVNSISTEQVELIQKKVSIISELFKKMRKIQKKINKIKKRIYQNKQFIEEIKAAKIQDIKNINVKHNELRKNIDTKEVEIKKWQKKFIEFESFIRKESQSYDKYKNLYKLFSMDDFIAKNNYLLQKKKIKKHENEKTIHLINIIKCENEINDTEIANKNKNIINNNKNDINDFIMIENYRNKYIEKGIDEMNKIYKSIYNIKKKTGIEENDEKKLDNTKSDKEKNSLSYLFKREDNNSYLYKSKNALSNLYKNYQIDSSDLSSD